MVDSSHYDINKDRVISDDEIKAEIAIHELDNRILKENQLRRMAWVAMFSMIIFTAILFLPIITIERVKSLSDLLSMFYIAQAGVVATFFGAQAFIHR